MWYFTERLPIALQETLPLKPEEFYMAYITLPHKEINIYSFEQKRKNINDKPVWWETQVKVDPENKLLDHIN